jgi:hypothetical protein
VQRRVRHRLPRTPTIALRALTGGRDRSLGWILKSFLFIDLLLEALSAGLREKKQTSPISMDRSSFFAIKSFNWRQIVPSSIS